MFVNGHYHNAKICKNLSQILRFAKYCAWESCKTKIKPSALPSNGIPSSSRWCKIVGNLRYWENTVMKSYRFWIYTTVILLIMAFSVMAYYANADCNPADIG